MVRGTVQPFKFKIPCAFNELSTARITFSQENYYGLSASRPLPITKVLRQCRQGSSPNELVVVLNKEETLRFTDKKKAYVQIMAETLAGPLPSHKPHIFPVYPVLDDSIFDEDMQPTPEPGYDGIVILDGATITKAGDTYD